DRRGVVKIVDLGLVRIATDTDELTRRDLNGAIIGTLEYLSPEQANDSAAVDLRADIYSLGATLYFLLTGKVLFPGGMAPQKLLRIQMAEPQPIRELRPEVPEGLAAVVRQTLAKHPDQRPQTAAELAEVLAPFAAPLPGNLAAMPGRRGEGPPTLPPQRA